MKRLDLQAIRGVAILLVILFHLQPEAFSLGFVGVDIFFVLSGFLMAVILSKEAFGKSALYSFYSRRYRRIVPLYFMVIVLVFIGTNFLLIPVDKVQFLEDVKWALPFLSNIQYLYEFHGYWDQVNDSRFFVHCWSLALEIQFYLIAPFIIFLSHRLSLKTRNVLLVTFILISCLFQVVSNSKIGYYLLPSRMWQFLLGILCFKPEEINNMGIKPENDFVTKKQPKNTENFPSSDFLILLMVFLAFCNPDFMGKDHVFRIYACCSIAFIIATNSDCGTVLSNKLLVYIGDISYAMYLVHWPIIVSYKYYYNLELLLIEDSLLLTVVIFLVTIAIHYCVEKPIITLSIGPSILTSIICIGFLYSFGNFYLFYSKPHNLPDMDKYKIEEIIRWNGFEKAKGFFPLPCDPDNVTVQWTNFSDDPLLRCQTYSTGPLKILVIGNSIAYRAFPKLHELLQGQYKELRLFARSASVPLANDPDSYPEFTVATRIVVKKMKPDIIWNIHGKIFPFTSFFDVDNKMKDPTFQQFQENIDFYSSYAKEVIIDLPYYWADAPAAYHIAKRFYLGVYDLSDLKVHKQKVEKQQFHHKRRLLALNCTNCHFTDVETKFFEPDDYYYMYDRKTLFAYTNDGYHFTPPMLDRVAPVYQQVIEDVVKKIALSPITAA